MSYLDQLMAQTGIDIVPAPPRVEDPLPIVEFDVPQAVSAAAVDRADEEHAPVATPPEARVVTLFEHGSPAIPLERTEFAPSPSLLPKDPKHDEVPTAVSPTRPREPVHPEIVIQQRHAESVAEREPPIAPSSAESSVKEQERTAPAPRMDFREQGDPVATPEAVPKPGPRFPTLIEVRRWVAAMPAAGKSSIETCAAQEANVVETPRARHSTPALEGSSVRRTESDFAVDRDAPRVDLSIGTVQVLVEAPPVPALPARPQPAAPRPPDELPTWPRLARRYVRL